MIVPTRVNLRRLARHVARPLGLLFCFDMIVAVAYVYGGWTWLGLQHIPLSIFGSAIGVIVGFRNNSSYQRWWEARTLWGAIVNHSRSFARQALSMVVPIGEDGAELEPVKRELVELQIAYVHALRLQLRDESPWAELNTILPDYDWDFLKEHRNAAFAIQQRMAELLRHCYQRGGIDNMRWAAMDRTLSALMNAQGGAERIKNTPMPRQYDFYPQAFVTVYCLLLPLGMVTNLELFTPFGSSLVGFIFLALDQIGRDLEAPFDNTEHDVPITSIARTIEINLRQALNDRNVPEPLAVVDGILW
jgi:putative membrane protein